MLDSLYGESDDPAERIDKRDVDAQFRVEYATKRFEEQVKARRVLSSNYCSYIIVSTLTTICCCFKSCFAKIDFMNAKIKKHQKFKLALDRLSEEQDIQAIISSNRVARIIHKATFKGRQRKAIDYSHKYIITDQNLVKTAVATKKEQNEKEDWVVRANTVVEGFDALNNEQDRRILYEMLGMRIYRDEFRDEDSSDSQREDKEPLLAIDYAFMYGNYDGDDAGDKKYTLNT